MTDVDRIGSFPLKGVRYLKSMRYGKYRAQRVP